MNFRFILAGAMLISSPAFAAEPVKSGDQGATEPQHVSAPVVLASADDVRQPSQIDQQAQPAPKRRVARVTTCRCGDPEPTSDQ